MIGFLTPGGEFIECVSWEHTSKAQEICLAKYNTDFYSGQMAEDYLLSLGYLCLRANDAYMRYSNDTQWILLTQPQLTWLSDNKDALNERQKHDINEILFDQESIRKSSHS